MLKKERKKESYLIDVPLFGHRKNTARNNDSVLALWWDDNGLPPPATDMNLWRWKDAALTTVYQNSGSIRLSHLIVVSWLPLGKRWNFPWGKKSQLGQNSMCNTEEEEEEKIQFGSRLHLCHDGLELHVLGCRVDMLGTNCDQCLCVIHCCFTSTETVRLIRTESPGWPPGLSAPELWCTCVLMKAHKYSLAPYQATYLNPSISVSESEYLWSLYKFTRKFVLQCTVRNRINNRLIF